MELLAISDLIFKAKAKAAVQVPAQMHQAYPIPVRGAGDLRVTFLYCVARPVFGEGLHMLAPSHLVVLSAVDGELKEVKAVTPAELGVNDAPQKILGVSKMPAGLTTEQFIAERELLYRSYDILMPLFAEKREPSPESATSFDARFRQLAEQPLMPYYHAVGKDFFAWVEAGKH
jgi:hypothetical protein